MARLKEARIRYPDAHDTPENPYKAGDRVYFIVDAWEDKGEQTGTYKSGHHHGHRSKYAEGSEGQDAWETRWTHYVSVDAHEDRKKKCPSSVSISHSNMRGLIRDRPTSPEVTSFAGTPTGQPFLVRDTLGNEDYSDGMSSADYEGYVDYGSALKTHPRLKSPAGGASRSARRSIHKCACGKRNRLLGTGTPGKCEECLLSPFMKPQVDPNTGYSVGSSGVSFNGKIHYYADELKKELFPEKCLDCGMAMLTKKGKYGLFRGCSAYPKCAGSACADLDLLLISIVQSSSSYESGRFDISYFRGEERYSKVVLKEMLVDELTKAGFAALDMNTPDEVLRARVLQCAIHSGGFKLTRIHDPVTAAIVPEEAPVEPREVTPSDLVFRKWEQDHETIFMVQDNKPAPVRWTRDVKVRLAILLTEGMQKGTWRCHLNGDDFTNRARYGYTEGEARIFVATGLDPHRIQVAEENERRAAKADQVKKKTEIPVIPTPATTTKPAVSTAEKKTTMVRKNTKDVMKASLITGAKVAAADEASNTMLAIAQKLLGDKFAFVLSSPEGRSFAKFFVATGIHYGADSMAPDSQVENLQAACQYVMEAASRDVIQPQLANLKPLLMDLVRIGGNMGLDAAGAADASGKGNS